MWSSVQDEAQADRAGVGSQGKFNSNPKIVFGLTNLSYFQFLKIFLQRF